MKKDDRDGKEYLGRSSVGYGGLRLKRMYRIFGIRKSWI